MVLKKLERNFKILVLKVIGVILLKLHKLQLSILSKMFILAKLVLVVPLTGHKELLVSLFQVWLKQQLERRLDHLLLPELVQ